MQELDLLHPREKRRNNIYTSLLIGLLSGSIVTSVLLPRYSPSQFNSEIINSPPPEPFEVIASTSGQVQGVAAVPKKPIKRVDSPYGDILNSYRIANKETAWVHNQLLSNSAQDAARDIATFKRAWSHVGYENYITKYYQGWAIVGENLARDFQTFDEVFSAWKASPTHNRNLLDWRTCEYGLGHYGDVWVLHTACKK